MEKGKVNGAFKSHAASLIYLESSKADAPNRVSSTLSPENISVTVIADGWSQNVALLRVCLAQGVP